MTEQGPDYTLRRPVDIYQPLPIVVHQEDEEVGGYFIQEDGVASKNRPPPSIAPKVRFSLKASTFLSVVWALFFFSFLGREQFFSSLPSFSSSPSLTNPFPLFSAPSQDAREVPVPVVSLLDDDVELSRFPRPPHLMVSSRTSPFPLSLSFYSKTSSTHDILRIELVQMTKKPTVAV